MELFCYRQVCGLPEKEKKWLPSWQECPVMTYMHYKACEIHPLLKPVMVQNNADYCQKKGQA